MIDFKNKNILITGASGGIGNAIVKKFVSLGGNVLGSGTNTEKLDLLKKKYPTIKVKKFDIASHTNIEEFIDNVTLELGSLDILINNAGINRDNISIRMKHDEEWKKVIDVNLTSTFILSKYAIKKMLKNKFGRVVNVTSVAGHTGNLGQSNYTASKAGIIGMSKSLAHEYAKKNITINCVSPGFIDSDMTMNIAEKVKLYLTSRIPMGKLGTGEDVSNCVAFLSSNGASYVTGETIHVNGGMYMS
jgi:3-oxoacyl-[acyl-carrier protein] reductase